MAETTLTAPDISCQHCRSTIESGMARVDGVRRVDVDVESRTVSLDYDESRTGEERLRDEMAELGYPVG